MVNLDLYRVFYTVAKNGSLTKAAEELYISQPAVSQSVKQLENQLGVTLFNRTYRGMELSEEGGKRIIGKVERALRLLEEAENEVSGSAARRGEELKIIASDGFLNFIIMDNGIRMSAEKMNALNAALAEAVSASTHTVPKSSHIGIHNINSRIKLIYGNEYGIRLSGTENKYIKISVKIPIEKSE